MTTPTTEVCTPLADVLAGAVRATLARRGTSMAKFAEEMGVGQVWLSRRLGRSRTVEITLSEACTVADALGVPLLDLLVDAS